MNRERKDAGRDRNAQAPAGFQADIEIRERHERTQNRAHQNRSQRELRHAVTLIHGLVPIEFNFFRT